VAIQQQSDTSLSYWSFCVKNHQKQQKEAPRVGNPIYMLKTKSAGLAKAKNLNMVIYLS